MRPLFVPGHESTTRHLASAYPFMFESRLSPRGTYVGQHLFGGSFVCDQFVLYNEGYVTSTNITLFGRLGRGKSALPKTWIYRSSLFGRRAWILDPKGEYHALARALGVEPVFLRPNGAVRINPLQPMLTRDGDLRDVRLEQLQLLGALASSALRRELRPEERTALELALEVAQTAALRVNSEPTLPMVVDALLQPTKGVGSSLSLTDRELTLAGRDVGLELRRLVTGDLRGMFDGETRGINLDSPVVVIDLSAVYHSDALGIIMTCVAAWLRRALVANAGKHYTTVVLDEAWALLSNLSVARWLMGAIKLSRQWGASFMVITHKLTDLTAAGAAGSEQVALAKVMFEDAEIRISYALPPGEVAVSAETMGLSGTERLWLPRLPKGRALWKVGERSFLVQHRLSPLAEPEIIDTNKAFHRTRYVETETEAAEPGAVDSQALEERLEAVEAQVARVPAAVD